MDLPPPESVLTTAQARASGLSRWDLRSGVYRSIRHDVHVHAGLDPADAGVRIAIAAAALPERTVVGGWAAARLHELGVADRQLDLFDGHPPGAPGRRPLPILVTGEASTRVHVTAGIDVFRSIVPPDERIVVAGVPVTTPLRTAFDLARLWPLVPAVVAVDRLLALGLVRLEDLGSMVGERARWRGVGGARRVAWLADAGAESPRETLLRLLWIGAGFPRPMCNPVVTDAAGRFVARVDLLDAQAGVVGEFDGVVHADMARRADDARRQEALEDLGLVVVRAAAPDLATAAGRAALRHRLARAYGRSRGRAAGAAAWRCDEPAAPSIKWSKAAVKRLKWSEVAPPCSTSGG